MRSTCSTFISSYPQRHWYQGDYSELDPETGLQAFDLRMYSSRIGRWLSVDPYAQYWSPYLAMGNNPVSEVDPDGGKSGDPKTKGTKRKNYDGSNPNLKGRSQKVPKSKGTKSPGSSSASSGKGGANRSAGGLDAARIARQFSGMRPASHYDYSQDVIPGKMEDDLDYILNGSCGNLIGRAIDLFKRDWVQASTSEKVELAFAAIPVLRIGKFVVPARTFHRHIKPDILKAVGDYEKIVGKNPDVLIENAKIVLRGNGSFRGRTLKTGLDPNDFFKNF